MPIGGYSAAAFVSIEIAPAGFVTLEIAEYSRNLEDWWQNCKPEHWWDFVQ